MNEEGTIICQNCENKLAKEAIICPKCGMYIAYENKKGKGFLKRFFNFRKKNKS
ncbi:MAG: hypothetical protein PHH17_03580 [Candidatus Pacebacteria bacterium]|jgi:predicted amidophosphoribosyltransferase|nr:hypothetical protein [Candidatus Paceibacterota bacterium]MDD3072209.1 hypothetical protein [Candidatus Paceibacterota bacterium]MDD3729035.1 hypothetical protein [Candidatus Paceibacterota bacterium]MDD4201166.1 hypothetical protein [Candidatus Paceibacterota bacterium]MDD4897257.1 hypothetical protein [Candidatus Paceibacterota bacterium]